MKETEVKDIIKGLAKGNSPKGIGKKLLHSKLSDSIQGAAIKKLDKECKEISKTSALWKCSSSDLQDFSLQTINIQSQTNAPFLYRTIDTLSKKNEIMNAVITSLLLRCRNIQLSRLHHIISQVLDHGGATDQVRPRRKG